MTARLFSHTYSDLLAWVMRGYEELNARTKAHVRVGRGGTAFKIDLSDGLLPVVSCRKTFPRSAAAEVAWFLLGERSTNFISTYTPMWNKFVDELGPNEFGVAAAYGYRWREHFGRDQIQLTIDALRKDRSDRRCYISAWDPASDGLGAEGQKNVPCPVGFSMSVTAGELHSSILLRSSDVFVGLPYDVMGHALLMDAVACELGVTPGVMHITLAHVHLYEHHWEMAEEALRQVPVFAHMPLPGCTVAQIVAAPDVYVTQYADAAQQIEWPKFNPRPHVVE